MILMYHHVSPLDEIPSDPQQFVREGWMFHTLPESLYAQIVYLRKRGYTFLAFSEYVEQVSRMVGEIIRSMHFRYSRPQGYRLFFFWYRGCLNR